MTDKPLQFHWSLSQAGDNFRASRDFNELKGLFSLQDQLDLCLKAEENGIDSMLMAIGYTRPDPLLLTVALGKKTKRIKFLVAVRSGLITPAYFVQQINTASTLIGDRININVVKGHTPSELKYYGDFEEKLERNERTKEFVAVCNAFWKKDKPVNYKGKYYQVENGVIETPYNSKRGRPEIYISGNSEDAVELVREQGDCLWRFPDAPETLKPKIEKVISSGKEAGLLTSIIARETQEEAEQAAKDLLKDFTESTKDKYKNFNKRFDSQGFKEILNTASKANSNWITSYLWNGAVPYMGPPSIALVGSYEVIANALLSYKKIGITQFLFIGWPDIVEIDHFGKGVLPLVRKIESQQTILI